MFCLVNEETLTKFESKGGLKAPSLRSLGEFSETVVTMLPNASFVESVLFGTNTHTSEKNEDHVMATLSPSSLIIDCSTVSPLSSQTMASKVQEVNPTSSLIDAPVSGGVTGAANGTLTFMVGGSKSTLDTQATPLLSIMGANIVHCGDKVGSGSMVKLCNNLALAIQMASVSEALRLGIKGGLDPAVLSRVMSTSTSRCWSVDSYNPCPDVCHDIPNNYHKYILCIFLCLCILYLSF